MLKNPRIRIRIYNTAFSYLKCWQKLLSFTKSYRFEIYEEHCTVNYLYTVFLHFKKDGVSFLSATLFRTNFYFRANLMIELESKLQVCP